MMVAGVTVKLAPSLKRTEAGRGTRPGRKVEAGVGLGLGV
jgi:hypothetical protein